MKKVLLFLLLALVAIFIFSCGSGGGGCDHTPVISNLNFNPTSSPQGISTQVNITFDFTDSGGDVATGTLIGYDSAMNEMVRGTVAIYGAGGITADTIIIIAVTDPSEPAGQYYFGVFITDSQGCSSNELQGPFTIN
ncbi:MAG: hypothetical protein JSV21_00280 [Nitrospirota bacterium]|nr:MAG: hypothetical protein JSV21_00280 [Nitrospirota bacterium]